jgi:hypothetical protein
LYEGRRIRCKSGDVGGDQVRSYARCPRTQEPDGLTEYWRCPVNARSLESTWSPPPTQEDMEKAASSMRAVEDPSAHPPLNGRWGERKRVELQDVHVAPMLPERAPSEGPHSTAAVGATWLPYRNETVQKKGERERRTARLYFCKRKGCQKPSSRRVEGI